MSLVDFQHHFQQKVEEIATHNYWRTSAQKKYLQFRSELLKEIEKLKENDLIGYYQRLIYVYQSNKEIHDVAWPYQNQKLADMYQKLADMCQQELDEIVT